MEHEDPAIQVCSMEEENGRAESSRAIEEEEDLFSHRTLFQRVQDLSFSLLFLMVHGNKSAHFTEYVSIAVEDLQLFTFFVGAEVNAGFELPDSVRNMFKAVEHSHMVMTSYFPIFTMAVLAITLMLANVVIVAVGVYIGQQRFIWPIRTLRIFAKFLPTVFFIPVFEALISVLTCNRVEESAEEVTDPLAGGSFPLDSINCSNPARQSLLSVAAIALFFYVPLSLAVNSVFYDFNPTLKGPSNKAHSRVDTIFLALKALIIVAFKFIPASGYLVKIALATAMCLVMFLCINHYFPNYNIRINQQRGGMYLATFTVGLITFSGSCLYANTGQKANYALFGMVVVATVGAFFLGAWLTRKRFEMVQAAVESRMEILQSPETNKEDYLVFGSWPDVEIAVRKYTETMGERRRYFNPANLAKLQAIFERGIFEFPDQPLIKILVEYYIFTLANGKLQRGGLCKIREPPLDVQFRIYYFNQIATRRKEADFLGLNIKLDVATYAEFQKTDRDAKLNHYLAVQSMRQLYKLIRDKNFKLDDLSQITVRLYMHAEKAQRAYLRLAAQFPRSKTILRFFARFCYDITKDEARGDSLTAYADELENHRTHAEIDGSGTPNKALEAAAEETPSSETGSSTIDRRLRESRMRLRGLQVKSLFVMKAIGILALWVANCYVVVQLLQVSQFSLTRLSWKYYMGTTALRIRQMEEAESLDDFMAARDDLDREMKNLSNIFKEIFMHREQSDPLENSYDTEELFPLKISASSPSNVSVTKNVSAFHFTELIANSALAVSNMSWDWFKSTSSYDSDIRLLLDNYVNSQPVLSVPMAAFIQHEWDKTSSAIKQVYILAGVQIFITVSLALVVDLLFSRFQTSQQTILEVLRYIPKDVIKEEIENFAAADSSDFFPTSIVKFAERAKIVQGAYSRGRFRTFMAVSSTVLISITIITAYLNASTFQNIGQIFRVLDFAASIKEALVRATTYANELLVNDRRTWQSPEDILENFSDSLNDISLLFQSIVFGDSSSPPPSPSYDHFPTDVLHLLNDEPCLPLNSTICEPTVRVWNETLSYSANLLTSGLLQATHVMIKFLFEIIIGVTAGGSDAPLKVLSLRKFLEPDVRDGWTQFRIRMMMAMDTIQQSRLSINYGLFSAFIVILFFTFTMEMFVVNKLLDNYRIAEQGIYGILSGLPLHARRIHQIAAVLKHATDDADAEAPAAIFAEVPKETAAEPAGFRLCNQKDLKAAPEGGNNKQNFEPPFSLLQASYFTN
ncbi:hypothetical protein DFJ73DRAFT_936523 [Zopfochytrium polystomum]|nr:hypothetical protein DFJ73DRAFT_936523 [Zopfochytrium polystomum]